MTTKTYARKWLAVMLTLVLLLSAVPAYLPVSAEETVDYGTQTFDSYEAKKYDSIAGTAGIAGNGEGRIVSADYDHTTGSGKSIKLEMKGYQSTASTPQSVALGADGTRLLLTKGKTYSVAAWLYSETDISLKYRIASAKQWDYVGGTRQNEYEEIITLTAGQWKRIVVDVTLIGLSNQDTAYLTIGATYADSAVTATGYVYLDDVRVWEYVNTAHLQTFEEYEAKKYDSVAGTGGIAGNGEGRIVSGDYNHTPGGSRSIKLEMKGYKDTKDTPQSVALSPNGTRLLLTKGKTYTVSVWLYSATDISLKYRLASAKQWDYVGNPAAGFRQNEYEEIITLTAGEWKQIVTDVTLTGLSGQDTGYLTIGATYADSAVTATGYVYLDDVQVKEKAAGNAVRQQDYDWLDNGQGMGLRSSLAARVSDEYDHTGTESAGQSLKVAMTSSAGTGREQFALLDSYGNPIKVEQGKTYDVSMWVYVVGSGGVNLNYWLCSSSSVQAVDDKSAAEYDVGSNHDWTTTGQWKKISFTTAPIANGSYLICGITTADANSVKRIVYVDDITVTEPYTGTVTNEQDYETIALDTPLSLRGSGTVSAEKNHTAGGGQSAKIFMNDQSGVGRPQMALLNSRNEPMQVETGKTYTVSMWVYVDSTEAAVQLNLWLCSSSTATALSNKSAAEYDPGNQNIAAGRWVQVTFTTEPIVNGSYLICGFATADANTKNRNIFVDDVTVKELVGFTEGEQTYEEYAVGKYDAGADGIHGNGSGREVSDEQNHTDGGAKSIKLNVNNSNKGYYARTVLPINGADFAVKRGECYTLSFWLYAAEDLEFTWFVGTTVSATDLYVGKNDEEKIGTVALRAGQWEQVTVNVSVRGHYAAETAYLTIGGLFAGCDTAPAPVWLDDVKLQVPDDLVTVHFHPEGGSSVNDAYAFAGETLGYLPTTVRNGYLFAGWTSADGSVEYAEDTVVAVGVDTLELYARWVKVPDTANALSTGFEVDEYTAVPYANDDPATAQMRYNMTATASWLKDAGFDAETGDGSMRLVNDPFVQDGAAAYPAFALMNPDGTPFVIKANTKYRLTYSYRSGENDSAHSYVESIASADSALTGVGTDDQRLVRSEIHGVQQDWTQVEHCFLAEKDGYVYFALCARGSTSEASSKGHAVYVDNVTVEVLDDTYSAVTFRCGTMISKRVGKEGSALSYPGFYVEDSKELEGWYTDAAYTQPFDADVFPTEDTDVYARLVAGDHTSAAVYVEGEYSLDFEETVAPTFYSAKKHKTYDNFHLDFITGDAEEAHSGDSYMRVNAISYNYIPSYFMLYDPVAPHNVLQLKPNSAYRVSLYVKMEEDFYPFAAQLCLGGPQAIGKDIQGTYDLKATVTADEWTKLDCVVFTDDKPAALSLMFDRTQGDGGTPLMLVDDISVVKLRQVKVTFDSNGGEPVAPIETLMGSVVEQPTDPYREGYGFKGWYTDKELKNAFDFSTPVTDDMLLYAKWRKYEIATDEEDDKPTVQTPPKEETVAPVLPEEEFLLDTGARPSLRPADPVVQEDEPVTEQPTPEGTFSIQMLLIIIAAVVVLVGGGALTVFLLRKKKANGKEEV